MVLDDVLVSATDWGGVPVDPLVLGFFVGRMPDERNIIILFSKSNQNGAPRDMAKVVASSPAIFKSQPQIVAGKVEGDQPITGWICSILFCNVVRFALV